VFEILCVVWKKKKGLKACWTYWDVDFNEHQVSGKRKFEEVKRKKEKRLIRIKDNTKWKSKFNKI
jgi:hypothetical protein